MPARRIPIFLVVLLVAIAVVNGFADVNHWYWTMRWFDMPMHFSGGVWLAGVAMWLYQSSRAVPAINFSKILAVCLTSALGIGLAWEIYEAGISYLTVGHINAMADTLSDLLFDTIGGTTVAVFIQYQNNSCAKNSKISSETKRKM